MTSVERLRELLARIETGFVVAPDEHSTTQWVPYRHVDEPDWRTLADSLPSLLAVAEAARGVIEADDDGAFDWVATPDAPDVIAALAAAANRLEEGKG